jgi:hypothetical protein
MREGLREIDEVVELGLEHPSSSTAGEAQSLFYRHRRLWNRPANARRICFSTHR